MTKPIHSLSPQELADLGIPVEVALRARSERCKALAAGLAATYPEMAEGYCLERKGLDDALAIIEAKS